MSDTPPPTQPSLPPGDSRGPRKPSSASQKPRVSSGLTSFIPLQPTVADCWKTIGVRGDGSCPELVKHVHCRNCHVYVEAGRSLLERRLPEDYRDEWTSLLAKPKDVIERGTLALFLFRLKSEWLALPTTLFVEVAEMRRFRPIPFRKDPVCQGLVNIRGELQLCVSLQYLLKIPDEPHGLTDKPRIMVIAKDGVRWAFPVDEVYGLARVKPGDIAKTPVTLSKASASHIKGSFQFDGHHAGILDDELVCYQLVRSVQ